MKFLALILVLLVVTAPVFAGTITASGSNSLWNVDGQRSALHADDGGVANHAIGRACLGASGGMAPGSAENDRNSLPVWAPGSGVTLLRTGMMDILRYGNGTTGVVYGDDPQFDIPEPGKLPSVYSALAAPGFVRRGYRR